MSSRREKKAQALKALKERRQFGGQKSMTEEYDFTEDDRIYDTVDEEEYREIVEQRRQREDFVVDDDGLGYHDDGEEVVGGQMSGVKEDHAESIRKKQEAKRRRVMEGMSKARRAMGDDGKEGGTNASMWDFLKTGGNGVVKSSKATVPASDDLDHLLDQLDQPRTVKQKKRVRKRPRRSYGRIERHVQKYTSPPENDHDDDDEPMSMPDDEPMPDVDPTPTRKLSFEHEEPAVLSQSSTGSKQSTPEEPLPTVEEPVAPRRKRLEFAKPQQRLSKAAQKAAMAKMASPPVAAPVAPPVVLTTESIPAGMTRNVASHVPLDTVVQKTDEENSFVDFFYLDVHEVKGNVYLFGKVKAPGNENYVSACVVVQNLVRNLFCLPRDGSSMQEVRSDIKSLLQPSIIPLTVGGAFKSKPVERNYAFDDPTIPREPTKYLKVVYSAQYPAFENVTESPHIAKILGSTFSPLELFLLKRKILGPSWIRIQNPETVTANHSWCKMECTVKSPKDITPITENNPPPPPITTVTLKLQTFPHANKQEILAVSAICNTNLTLDGSEAIQKKKPQHICIARPLKGSFPRDFSHDSVVKAANERALLSRLFVQIGLWDPDVLVGHAIWSLDMPTLLSRAVEHKVPTWTKLGRRRWVPKLNKFQDYQIREASIGRVLCDTYLSSQELLKETTYSLTHLAASQFQTERTEIDREIMSQYFVNTPNMLHVIHQTLNDAQLIENIMTRLKILPLTRQLTCLAGYLWGKTLKGQRAERNEYLLLHEFHKLKYIPPEKIRDRKKGGKYSGGLVLEPKKGLYDSYILLLDFNSLYPSIIQEYNLCFTTMDWVNDQESLPDSSVKQGVLPKVIKSLVERRKQVKKYLKAETNEMKKKELDIRQQAIKLTANSMYGCLGFSNSRFYAQSIAALITSQGRDTLQRTVDIARDDLGLDVIYGDTDSIMINTLIPGTSIDDLEKVKEMGRKVKHQVNSLYKTLELEVDGYFKSMLLLKKKKYAALTVTEQKHGPPIIGKEMKGLDLVRRDWCIQSKESGVYILDQILSGNERDQVIMKIEDHLQKLAENMRNGNIGLEKYVITKGLSKHPNDYPDGKSQPHVVVAKSMLEANKPVNSGDHIPYIICTEEESDKEEGTNKKEKVAPAAERARHPEEIKRSSGALKPDVEWYISQQILNPIARLCEPIEGLSQGILAGKLGIDSSKYNHHDYNIYSIDDNNLVSYTPASCLLDKERYQNVEKLIITCKCCGNANEANGAFNFQKGSGSDWSVTSGFRCANASCSTPDYYGYTSHEDLYVYLVSAYDKLFRKHVTQYYTTGYRCDDPSCNLQTHQISVVGSCCLARGCGGRMHPVHDEKQLYTQLKYFVDLYDIQHTYKQLKMSHSTLPLEKDILQNLPKEDKDLAKWIHQAGEELLNQNSYNFVGVSFFQALLQ